MQGQNEALTTVVTRKGRISAVSFGPTIVIGREEAVVEETALRRAITPPRGTEMPWALRSGPTAMPDDGRIWGTGVEVGHVVTIRHGTRLGHEDENASIFYKEEYGHFPRQENKWHVFNVQYNMMLNVVWSSWDT